MKLKITIDLDNDAFQYIGDGHSEFNAGLEVARILRELAGRMNAYGLHGATEVALYDLNGNAVGKVELVRSRKESAR